VPFEKSSSLPVSDQAGDAISTSFAARCSGGGRVSGSSPGMAAARMAVRVAPGSIIMTLIGVEAVSFA